MVEKITRQEFLEAFYSRFSREIGWQRESAVWNDLVRVRQMVDFKNQQLEKELGTQEKREI